MNSNKNDNYFCTEISIMFILGVKETKTKKIIFFSDSANPPAKHYSTERVEKNHLIYTNLEEIFFAPTLSLVACSLQPPPFARTLCMHFIHLETNKQALRCGGQQKRGREEESLREEMWIPLLGDRGSAAQVLLFTGSIKNLNLSVQHLCVSTKVLCRPWRLAGREEKNNKYFLLASLLRNC